MQPDEMFMKVVQKLQRDNLLNARRNVRFQYVEDDDALERSTAKQVNVSARDIIRDPSEEYANALIMRPMADYLSKSPPSAVTFSASLFRVYFPIGRSGEAEVILDTAYLNSDDKVTEKNKIKIRNIEKELREEDSHS